MNRCGSFYKVVASLPRQSASSSVIACCCSVVPVGCVRRERPA